MPTVGFSHERQWTLKRRRAYDGKDSHVRWSPEANSSFSQQSTYGSFHTDNEWLARWHHFGTFTVKLHGRDDDYIRSKPYNLSSTKDRWTSRISVGDWAGPGPDPFKVALPALLFSSYDVTTATAVSSPETAEVQPLVFLAELREIPSLLKSLRRIYNFARRKGSDRSDNLFQAAGEANLSWSFGVKPTLGDIVSLVGIAESAQRRLEDLARAGREKGLRKRVILSDSSGSFSQTDPKEIAWKSHYSRDRNCVQITRSGKWTMKRWAVVRWVPGNPDLWVPPPPKEVYKNLLGLQRAQLLSNAWELIPWSWLIDWFTNIGSTLATLGDLGLRPDTMNLCGEYEQTTSYKVKVVTQGNKTLSVSSSSQPARALVKARHAGLPTLGIRAAYSPITWYQLGIIASLVATR